MNVLIHAFGWWSPWNIFSPINTFGIKIGVKIVFTFIVWAFLLDFIGKLLTIIKIGNKIINKLIDKTINDFVTISGRIQKLIRQYFNWFVRNFVFIMFSSYSSCRYLTRMDGVYWLTFYIGWWLWTSKTISVNFWWLYSFRRSVSLGEYIFYSRTIWGNWGRRFLTLYEWSRASWWYRIFKINRFDLARS